MSFRSWVTAVTFILLALVVYFGWNDIMGVWMLLGRVNVWLLLALVPIQLFSYYATGNIIFSYLRAKGNLQETSHWVTTRMALELNFVNHILPSGGAAGFSYLGWVLHKHGVGAGRATMAQIVRFSMTFISFLAIMAIAVVSLILDHQIDRIVILVSASLASVPTLGALLLIYIIGNRGRLTRFSNWLARTANRAIFTFSRGKSKRIVKRELVENFFDDLHQDYLEIKSEKNILTKPFMWSVLQNIADVILLMIAFMALGAWVNPAILFIAFGASAIASITSVMPAGAGVYEAIMIGFLASAGVPADVAIAGTLLARVTLVLGTILFGYLFYQLTILKYGKRPTDS